MNAPSKPPKKGLAPSAYRRRFYTLLILLIGFLSLTGMLSIENLVQKRSEILLEQAQLQVSQGAQERARFVSLWAQSMRRMGEHAGEATQAFSDGKNAALTPDEAAQFLGRLASQNNMTAVTLFGAQNNVALSTTDIGQLTPEQKTGLEATLATRAPYISSLRHTQENIVVDLFAPIDVALKNNNEGTNGARVIMSTVPVDDAMSFIISPVKGPNQARTALMQILDKQDVYLLKEGILTPQPSTLYDRMQKRLTEVDSTTPRSDAVKISSSLIDQHPVVAATKAVQGTPLVVLHEMDAEQVLATLPAYRRDVSIRIGLSMFTIGAILAGLMFYITTHRNRQRVQHQEQMLSAIVRAIETRDPYLKGHHNRVARTAVTLGNNLELPTVDRSTLFYAAKLAGIGKIFIPENILNKESKLTQKERAQLEGHVSKTIDVLSELDFSLPVEEVIQHMYERMDGSGYPQGVKGDDIPTLSRVLAVCDVYCALTSPRHRREALSPEEALKIMRKEESKYDREILEILERIISGQ